MVGEFLGRAVSATEWKIVISSGSPTGGSSLPDMNLQQLTDIEFKLSAIFTSRQTGKPAPNLTYTPNPGFVGIDSFIYKVNDGKTDSAEVTVTIIVDPTKVYLPLTAR